MDPSLVAQFAAAWAYNVKGQADHANQLAMQTAGALQLDNRIFGGFIATQLFSSDDPSEDARLNTAIRVPSTIDHYALGGGFSPAGAPAGGGAATPGK